MERPKCLLRREGEVRLVGWTEYKAESLMHVLLVGGVAAAAAAPFCSFSVRGTFSRRHSDGAAQLRLIPAAAAQLTVPAVSD